MRKILILKLLLVCLYSNATVRNSGVTFLPQDSITICRMLNEVKMLSSTANIPLFFARKFLNIPYVAHTLEVNDDERLVVNTRQLDCTTFVETVTSLSICAYRHLYTWNDYLDVLMNMRYRHGRIVNYTSRIHYFTEWITANMQAGIVTEIQVPDPPFSEIQQVNVNYMSRHLERYKALRLHPEFVSTIRRTEQQISGGRYRYIPKSIVGKAALLRKTIKDGDIIAICSNKKGLDIAHLGLAVWIDGELHLLNASQLHKKVVEEPMTLYQYLQKHPSHTGIRIIRINK